MGSCCTSTDANNQAIDSKMKQNEAIEKKCHKLLFLGPGGGGKSTIFKQLQWLHGGGFDEIDIKALKRYINIQIMSQMQSAIKRYLSQPIEDTQLQNEIDRIKKTSRCIDEWTDSLALEITESIAYIWKNDERLKDIFQNDTQQHIMWSSTKYFWNEIPRITASDYIPTKVDIMKVRKMTTGVEQKRFAIGSCNFHIFDVGGQKSERRKWITCFDNVSVLVFVASLSCYNELMFEDQTMNCMQDTIKLFDETINNTQFTETAVILFLNKKDLFKEKIKNISITSCSLFEDFDENVVYDSDDYKDEESNYYHQCAAFVRSKFEEKNKSQKRPIYTHFTCALDDKNIEFVFSDIVNIVVRKINQGLLSTDLL